jgi:predicted N-acyltransferase
VQRGYLPRSTYSAHWIADPAFRDAIGRFLDDERKNLEEEMKYLAGHSPFRKAD